MSGPRTDTLEKYFKPAEFMDNLSNATLWISVAFSFLLFYMGAYPQLKAIMNVLFIVITFLYFVLSNYSSLYLARQAQNKRLTNLISNSFGVLLDDEQTNLFYNNSQSPSITRLGMNVFENSLFSKTTAIKMVTRERIKIVGLIVLWVILMSYRNTSLELLSIVAQTLLTTTIVTNWIKLEILRHGFETIYESCRKLFLNSNTRDDLFTSQVLDIVMKYEVLKASMGIKLSSIIFHEINDEITLEWERIKTSLHIT